MYELKAVCSEKCPLKGSCYGDNKSLFSQMVGNFFLVVQHASTSLVKSAKEAIILLLLLLSLLLFMIFSKLLLLYNMYVSCHRHFFLVLLLNQR